MSDVNFYPHKHVAAIARDLWKESNPKACDASTLGGVCPNYYLFNRLDAAFSEGWNAAERHYKHMMELNTTKI